MEQRDEKDAAMNQRQESTPKRISYPRLYLQQFAVGFTLMLGMGLPGAFLPILARELDPVGVLVGAVTSAWFVARIFIELPSGILSDRIGRARLIIVGLALSVLGAFLCATSGSIYMLILGRAVWGLGTAFFFANNTALLMDMFEGDARARAVGNLQGIEFIGAFIAAPIGAFIAEMLGYYSVFYIATAMILISFSIAFLSRELRRVAGRSRRAASNRSLRRDLRSLKTWKFSVICIGVMTRFLVMQGLMSTTFQLYLNQSLSYSIESIGIVLGVRTAGFCAATFLSGQLATRTGSKPIIVGGLLIQIISLYLYTVTGDFGGTLLIGLADGFGSGAVSITLVILLSEAVAAEVRGTAVGVYRTFQDIGGALGPIMFMFVYEAVGRQTSFLLGAALLFASLVLEATLRTEHHKQEKR
jgi:MFS family permease